MSRPDPGDDIQTLSLVPPVRGLYHPYRSFNPGSASGYANECMVMRIRNNVLSIMEGNVAINASALAAEVYAITSYQSPTKKDLVLVIGNSIYYIDQTGGAVNGPNLVGAMTTTPTERVCVARFRNRYLFGLVNSGGLYWYDPENRTMRKAGPTVPGTVATGAVGVGGLTGNYKLVYTFVNDQGHEGNPSTASAIVAPAGQNITWTVTAGPTGTSSRRLYRTVASGDTYLFLTEISDNVTLTYADNVADAALGDEVDDDNTDPPSAIRQITVSRTRVYLLDADGLTVWASKIDATTGLPNWEAYPSKLSLDMAFSGGEDKGKAIMFASGDVYVFGGLKTARIVGDVASGVAVEQALDEGIFSPYALTQHPDGTISFLNQIGQLKHFNLESTEDWGESVQADLNPIKVGYSGGLMYGQSGPALDYDHQNRCLYLNSSSSTTTNNLCLCFEIASKQWFNSKTIYDVAHYSEFRRNFYGWSRGDPTNVYGARTNDSDAGYTYATANGSAYGTGVIPRYELLMVTPSPGDDIDFLTLQLSLRAVGVFDIQNPPQVITVEYAFDNNQTYMKKQFIYRAYGLVANHGLASSFDPVMNLSLGIYRVARWLNLRITPGCDTITNSLGVEIYGLRLDCRILNQARDGRRSHGGEMNQRIYR